MDPVTAALILSGGIKLVSGLFSSQSNADAIRRQDYFNREMTKVNVELLENQRQDVIFQGARETGRVRQAAEKFKGAQTVAFAAQGVDVGSGSAALIQADTQYLAEIDALETKNNARKSAYGFQVQKREAIMQQNFNSAAAKQQARQTIITGGMNAISDVAGTFSSVHSYLNPKVKT